MCLAHHGIRLTRSTQFPALRKEEEEEKEEEEKEEEERVNSAADAERIKLTGLSVHLYAFSIVGGGGRKASTRYALNEY
jgi:CO dehydrogenase/acetyl-CoA synthase beta subunit